MIYSRWRPDTGGYDYFESSERYALADDLPTPPLGGSSPIGVSSLKCGRPIPMGAAAAGSGRFAKGVIAPLSRAGLSGDGIMGMPRWASYLGIGAALAGIYFVGMPWPWEKDYGQ
mgnify:CR=1 FL=1